MKYKVQIVCLVTMISLLIPLSIIACKAPVAEQEPIKIGGMFDLTGPLVAVGMPGKYGTTLALEDVGYKLDGRPIEFIIEDAATDVSVAMDKARKLVEVDKVSLVIGPVFGPTMQALAAYFDKVKVPQLTYGALGPPLILENDWTWMTGIPTTGFGYLAGRYAGRELGYKRVTVLVNEMVSGHEFAEGFTMGLNEEGGQVIQEQYFPMGAMDFSPYFIQLKKEADAFMIWAPAITAIPLFKQLREFGVTLPIICPEPGGTMEDPETMTQQIGKDILGVRSVMIYAWTIDNGLNKKFVEAYRKNWGTPGYMAACAYADIEIVLEALRKSGGDISPAALAKSLDNLSIDTIRGHISFTKDHVAVHDLFIGEIVLVGDRYEPKIIKTYVAEADVVDGKFEYSFKEK